ncbi:hypothetical protein CP985_03380 [Malaciobacter mytili LMG 24559]|uniref:Thioredoxin-like fold domain-containing protein n=1 Tax=Malaciobacter mytili LMG 24559 TaxID=1032238 RepID=A0AAX2AL56_9BACT|nr:thioredoxin fold domain-containing protein [Malaciobacter mytili]AXH16399.1 hypothetical protein AMYT_a0101 [Malaciobacter mytili LMG 24559]RXK16466.1 hypothetical protein CP985_03380 [Malaciobacter mytili LMG 24559]
MKKTLLITTLLASSLFANEQRVDLEQFKSIEMIKKSGIYLKQAKKLDDKWFLLEGKQNGRKLNLYTDKNMLIVGRGFNLKDFKEIKFDIDTKKYKENALFKIGNGPNEYILFTDPECPYCRMLDEKLSSKAAKENFTIYTYFFPLSFHLAAVPMSKAILNQPKERRAEYSSKLMNMQLDEIIKEVDKYSNDLYKNILIALDNQRMSQLALKYVDAINKAYNLKLATNDEIKKYCASKITQTKDNVKIDNMLNSSIRNITDDFEISGTPTLYDMEGNKINNPNEIFSKHPMVNMDAIKKIEKLGKTIKLGKEGAEKLYIFSSTKCPHCVEQFKNKKFIDYLKSKYELNFVLMNTGNPNLALAELIYLHSINDMKKRAVEFEAIMNGKRIDNLPKIETLDKNAINAYMKLIDETYVNSTPVIISKDGKIIDSPNKL